MSEESPHLAYRVYQVVKAKAFEQMFPGLRAKPEKEALIMLMLIIGSVAAGAFGALFASETINPPKRLIGTCPPPAQLYQISGSTFGLNLGIGAHVECLTTVVSTSTMSNGVVTTVQSTQTAGTLRYQNGTAYNGG